MCNLFLSQTIIENRSFSYTIQLDWLQFPLLYLLQVPYIPPFSPRSILPSLALQKGAGLQKREAKRDNAIQWRKRSQELAKESEIHTLPLLEVSQKHETNMFLVGSVS